MLWGHNRAERLPCFETNIRRGSNAVRGTGYSRGGTGQAMTSGMTDDRRKKTGFLVLVVLLDTTKVPSLLALWCEQVDEH